MNLPNKLSILRICMIPVYVAVFFLPYAFAPYLAAAVFLLAAFTDFLDGHIARKYNMVTDLGKLLDPMADKVLVTAALFCVVGAGVMQFNGGWTTVFLASASTLILARELLISAVRQIAAAKGSVIQANVFGKIKTVSQDISLPLLTILQAEGVDKVLPHQFYVVVWWIALVIFSFATLMTVVSGVIYLVQNRHVFAE